MAAAKKFDPSEWEPVADSQPAFDPSEWEPVSEPAQGEDNNASMTDYLKAYGKGSGGLVASIGALAETPVTSTLTGLSGLGQRVVGLMRPRVVEGQEPKRLGVNPTTGEEDEVAPQFRAETKVGTPFDRPVEYWSQKNAEEQKSPYRVGTALKEAGNLTSTHWGEEMSKGAKADAEYLNKAEGGVEFLQRVWEKPEALLLQLTESVPGTVSMFIPGMGMNKAAKLLAPYTKSAVAAGEEAALKAIAAGETDAAVATAAKKAITDHAQAAMEKHIGAVSVTSEGAQSAGSALNSTQQAIDATSEDKLQAISPRYRELLKNYSSQEARGMLKAEAGGVNAAISMIGDMVASKIVGGGGADADIIQSGIGSGRQSLKIIHTQGKEEVLQNMAEEVGQYQTDLLLDPKKAGLDLSKAAVSGYVSGVAMSAPSTGLSYAGNRLANRGAPAPQADLLNPDKEDAPPSGGLKTSKQTDQDREQKVYEEFQAAQAEAAAKKAAAEQATLDAEQQQQTSAPPAGLTPAPAATTKGVSDLPPEEIGRAHV